MNLIINGETREHSADTLSALVEHLGMKPDRVAIELNRNIVSRDQWPRTPLHDGDRLEIVHFVGGGAPVDPTAPMLFRRATAYSGRFGVAALRFSRTPATEHVAAVFAAGSAISREAMRAPLAAGMLRAIGQFRSASAIAAEKMPPGKRLPALCRQRDQARWQFSLARLAVIFSRW
jgi:sulfur carrier protein